MADLLGGIPWSALVAENAGTPAAATYVGSETCAGCHQAEAKLWQTSQHKKAMAHATEQTVLGDFSGVTFDYYGVTSRFFRKDGKFLVETDGPDGKLATFEIKYTFGVDPLAAIPDRISRRTHPGAVDRLGFSRPKDKGGQRWFHLYPDENISHDDVLHWTKLNQNWNFMCAECHSTGVRKNYDAATDRFATTWSEISVGCETCHGTGSAHVTWARNQQSWWPFGKREDRSKGLAVRFDERANVTWAANPQTGKPQRSIPPALLRTEVETCGFCHARARRILRGLGARATGCPIRIGCRHSSAGSFMPTARPAMSRSPTIISPSSRARCSQRASPAAIATSRTAPRCVRPAMASACNATPPINSIPPPTAIMTM